MEKMDADLIDDVCITALNECLEALSREGPFAQQRFLDQLTYILTERRPELLGVMVLLYVNVLIVMNHFFYGLVFQ